MLFGIGNKRLLNTGGLAVVGSRKIEEAEVTYTQAIAKQAAAEGINIISVGARGVDETAMLATLETEGNALGVLANDLLKSAVAGKWRKYLKNEQLALISPYYPEAKFRVGNAMGRNKYIYTLADNAVVVRSELGSGGTWAGATENIKKAWIPLFVASPSAAESNAELIAQGAYPLELVCDDNMSTEWLGAQLTKNTAPQSQLSSG